LYATIAFDTRTVMGWGNAWECIFGGGRPVADSCSVLEFSHILHDEQTRSPHQKQILRSLLCPQKPNTSPYLEPVVSSTHLPTISV